MKELARMRLGVLREIKNMRIFLDNMERTVKKPESRGYPKSLYVSCTFGISHGQRVFNSYEYCFGC